MKQYIQRKRSQQEKDQNIVLNNSGMSSLPKAEPFEYMFSNGSLEEANLVYNGFSFRENDHKKNNIFSDALPQNILENNESTIPHQEEDEDGTFSCLMMMDSIPVIRELMVISEAEAGGTISFNSFFKLLRKLRLTSSRFEAKRIFEQINKSEKEREKSESCTHEQFFLFFSKEISQINLSQISVTELIMRLGLELFRVLGQEKTSLELRDIMNYNKKYKDLDIDFIQLLEMFEFYDNIYSGAIKKKQTIVHFFQNCVVKLVGALKSSFIFELQDLLKNTQLNSHNSLQQSKTDSSTSTLKLKVYDNKDRETRNIHKRVLKNAETKLEKESIQGLLQKNFNVNFEVALEDNGFDKEDHVESEIEDYFLENRPKNKGWLFRKSKKHQNKWSNLFFYIYHDNSSLVSVKPTTLKREMDCENIELFKCSFIELLDYQEAKKACMERRKYRNKNNFISVTEGDRPVGGTIPNTNSNDGRLLTQTARKNEMQNFFLYDKAQKKHYLIRSEESLIIMSTISFYSKTLSQIDKGDKIRMAELAQFYSEYSGIIEIALCKKQQINQSYTDLSSFAFKPQYLIIKQGKCRIYNMKQKDKIDLMEYQLKIDSTLPFTPSNPFSFLLEKVSKLNEPKQDDKKRDDQSQVSQQSSVVMFNPLLGLIDSRRAQNLGTGIDSRNTLGGRIGKGTKEQKPQSQGIFQKLFSSICKKTPERLVIAADSEYKRKQWIFTINFHKTLLVRMKKKNKSSFGYYQSFNANQFFSNQNTLENETQQQNNCISNAIVKSSQQQQQLLYGGQSGFSKKSGPASYGRIMGFSSNQYGSAQQIKPSFKLSEIEGDNDFYDIFAQKDVVEEVKEEEDDEESPKLTSQFHPSNTKFQPHEINLKQQNSQIYPQSQEYQQSCTTQHNVITKNSIIKTTEEGMYTMSFPMNNPIFKKSLMVQENSNMIPNSKEIRTISDEELCKIDLSVLTNDNFGQSANIHSDHKVSNNQSSQKYTTIDLKYSNDPSVFNQNGRRSTNQLGYVLNSDAVNISRKNYPNDEMQSTHKYYEYESAQHSRNDEVESEQEEEPQAQTINFRNTFVHKLS